MNIAEITKQILDLRKTWEDEFCIAPGEPEWTSRENERAFDVMQQFIALQVSLNNFRRLNEKEKDAKREVNKPTGTILKAVPKPE